MQIRSNGFDPQRSLVTIAIASVNAVAWNPHTPRNKLWNHGRKLFIRVTSVIPVLRTVNLSTHRFTSAPGAIVQWWLMVLGMGSCFYFSDDQWFEILVTTKIK